MPVFLLDNRVQFPPPRLATEAGLLAIGGDLSQKRLLLAYQMGIFPWFSEGEPIMWWSPDPRLVLYPDELRISKSLRKAIRQEIFEVTIDSAFEQVIRACAETRRKHEEGTWIVDDMIEAYCGLHAGGFAHSVEAWHRGELAGGLYGVSRGGCFFGESMFARVDNASKVALVRLVEHLKALSFDLIDCQVTTAHLKQFGAREIPRSQFLGILHESVKGPVSFRA